MKELLEMKYIDIIEYLKNKYGIVKKNYFTEGSNPTVSIKRGNEGL